MEKTMTMEKKRSTEFALKDPFSSLSHLIFAGISFLAGIHLIARGFEQGGKLTGLSMLLFVIGLVGLYLASGVYHALDISPAVNKRLRKVDHSMIYVLIAGTYSPLCLTVIKSPKGIILFIVVWSLALAGIILALCWIDCPKWMSSLIYILMGWTCIFAYSDIVAAFEPTPFAWLLAGGIIYTIGGVIYALRLKCLSPIVKGFGNHELFHLFCIGGSLCHYILMLYFV